MNQVSPKSEGTATPAPRFLRITIGLLAMLLLCGAAAAVWLVHEADNINRAGGWGWLLVGAIYITATTVVCLACAITTIVSLFRREAHRRVSIAMLPSVPSCEVVVSFAQFWSGASVEAIRNELMAVSTPSVINEHERMAMFYPHARDKTSDKRDRERGQRSPKGSSSSSRVPSSSYQSAPAGDRPNPNR
jgi:hypothetical protein